MLIRFLFLPFPQNSFCCTRKRWFAWCGCFFLSFMWFMFCIRHKQIFTQTRANTHKLAHPQTHTHTLGNTILDSRLAAPQPKRFEWIQTRATSRCNWSKLSQSENEERRLHQLRLPKHKFASNMLRARVAGADVAKWARLGYMLPNEMIYLCIYLCI